ncbi:MAG: F-type H+-transporting ATPase subunit b [Candidatus Marivariicella framensis]|mgnify:FL=1|jgi:F-type H+-transporting ATPase subunit b|tara:strand:+ start:91 stop:588 length:498 start_codon:yes stop_codon:yes gene_type:complete
MEKLINEFSFGLFFWQLLIFIGLVLLLKKYAWKPILDAVNEREFSIREALSSADNARKEMESLNEDNQRIIKEARSERESLLKEARNTSSKIIEEAKQAAKISADQSIKQAQESIESEKRAAIQELKTQVAGIAIQMAEKVLHSELDDKDKQNKLIERLLKETKL